MPAFPLTLAATLTLVLTPAAFEPGQPATTETLNQAMLQQMQQRDQNPAQQSGLEQPPCPANPDSPQDVVNSECLANIAPAAGDDGDEGEEQEVAEEAEPQGDDSLNDDAPPEATPPEEPPAEETPPEEPPVEETPPDEPPAEENPDEPPGEEEPAPTQDEPDEQVDQDTRQDQ